jgi:hypothetical protein
MASVLWRVWYYDEDDVTLATVASFVKLPKEKVVHRFQMIKSINEQCKSACSPAGAQQAASDSH